MIIVLDHYTNLKIIKTLIKSFNKQLELKKHWSKIKNTRGGEQLSLKKIQQNFYT